MRTLSEVTGYATQANAMKAAEKAGIDLNAIRWVMTVTPSGRFIVTVGTDNMQLIHTGKVAVFG